MRPAPYAIAVLVVLTTGCAADASERVQRERDTILLVADSEPEAVMEAIVEGTLTLTADGCFAIESGEVVHPLQFPFGTRLASDGRSAVVPELGTVRVGDGVRGGGGFVAAGEVPEACRVDDELAVWQTLIDE